MADPAIPPTGAAVKTPTGTLLPRDLIGFDITICGLLELDTCRADGITHVMSLVDPTCDDPMDEFRDYPPHHRIELRLEDVIDHAHAEQRPPLSSDVQRILTFGKQLQREKAGHVLIHCHAGKSRSTAATAIILAQANPGREADAFEALRAIRKPTWPNSLMIRMADAMLGRQGRLVSALFDHFRMVIEDDPEWGERIRPYREADFRALGLEAGAETGLEAGAETGLEDGTETGIEAGAETGLEAGAETGNQALHKPAPPAKPSP